MNLKIFNSTEDENMRVGRRLFILHYEAEADLLPSKAWVSGVTDTLTNLDGHQVPSGSTFRSPPQPQALQPRPCPEPQDTTGGLSLFLEPEAHPPPLSPLVSGRPAPTCHPPSYYQAWRPPRDFPVSEVIVHNYFFDKLGFHKGGVTWKFYIYFFPAKSSSGT